MGNSTDNGSIEKLLKETIKKEIDRIDKKLEETIDKIERSEELNGESGSKNESLNDDIKIARKYIEILKKSNLEQPEKIFKVISASGSLSRQFNNIINKISAPTIKHLFNHLMKSILSLSSYLWQLISQHMSLKEWSVSGGINGGIFGLSGTAKIQLTFDKNPPPNQKQ